MAITLERVEVPHRKRWTREECRRLYIHRRPASDGYREVQIYSETEEVSPLARPDTTILVSSLLPSATVADEIASE